jgi:hypothetical protein
VRIGNTKVENLRALRKILEALDWPRIFADYTDLTH